MTKSTKSFAAAAMITAGGLILLLCGPCTLFFAGSALITLVTEQNTALSVQILIMALVVGGLPTLLGWFLLRSGLRRTRAAKPPPSSPPPP